MIFEKVSQYWLWAASERSPTHGSNNNFVWIALLDLIQYFYCITTSTAPAHGQYAGLGIVPNQLAQYQPTSYIVTFIRPIMAGSFQSEIILVPGPGLFPVGGVRKRPQNCIGFLLTFLIWFFIQGAYLSGHLLKVLNLLFLLPKT